MMTAATPPNGTGQKSLVDHWRQLNFRGKLVVSSLAIVAGGLVSWNQIGDAYSQSGMPVPATRGYVEYRLQPVKDQLRDVKREILRGQLQSAESSEERITGEQVSLRLKLPDLLEPAARRIIENRLATIEIERAKLQATQERLRSEIDRLQ